MMKELFHEVSMGIYDQHLNHSSNHHKNKFTQQCGFHFSDTGVKSAAAIAETCSQFCVLIDDQWVAPIRNNPDVCVEDWKELGSPDNARICAYPSKLTLMQS